MHLYIGLFSVFSWMKIYLLASFSEVFLETNSARKPDLQVINQTDEACFSCLTFSRKNKFNFATLKGSLINQKVTAKMIKC